MNIIGFDPGSVIFGIGIISKEGQKISYLHSEEFKFAEKVFFDKMRFLWNRLQELYSQFSIEEAAIEEGFLGKNVKSMDLLAKIRGVVLGSLLDRGVNLQSYSPREVKLAITGNGNALKSQVSKMVKVLFALREQKVGEDEGDALAVAYCHSLRIK